MPEMKIMVIQLARYVICQALSGKVKSVQQVNSLNCYTKIFLQSGKRSGITRKNRQRLTDNLKGLIYEF